MYWQIKGVDDDLSYYTQADTAEAAKERVEAYTGYLKPNHITITQVDSVPEDETIL